jgi:hypothetical protein
MAQAGLGARWPAAVADTEVPDGLRNGNTFDIAGSADAVSRSHLTSCCDPVVGGNRFTELAPIVSVSLNGQPDFVAYGANLRLLLAPLSGLPVGDRQAVREDQQIALPV